MRTAEDRAGDPAGRPPSMGDVAHTAGVSHQTVSRVLNDSSAVKESTRLRVVAAIEELGYRRNGAARALARNRSGRVGLVVAHLEQHGPSQIVVAVQEACHRAGYEVSLVTLPDPGSRSFASALERLLDERVEALVVAAAQDQVSDAVARLDLQIPVVLAQGVGGAAALSADIDQQLGAHLATRHLLDLGHRRVAHVSGPADWVEATQRREGWRAAHEELSLEPGPLVSGDWSAVCGYRAGIELARDTEVSAVFAANDTTALGLLRAFHEVGRRVPEDVSVVGFDDHPDSGFFWPALTTVDQDFAELGRRAVHLALRALEGEVVATRERLCPSLVVRASTSAPTVAG